jgi:hypothetical protein
VFQNYEIDIDKNVIINGCFDTNKHTLQKSAVSEDVCYEMSKLPTYEQFKSHKKAIMTVVRKMKIETIGCPRFEDCLMSHFKVDSQPGFTQFMINKNKTKKSAFRTSSRAARVIFNKLDDIARTKRSKLTSEFIKNKPKSKGLYTIGARNKRDYSYENFELGASRAVHMPEFHNEISTSAWIDMINDSIKARSRGPIYIGNSITTFERFEKDMLNNSNFLEGDWRKYDSTYRVLGIIICACITRLFYPLYSKRADVHFYWIFYLHLVKDYYMPGGNVIRILNGLPSGTKCTSIWNSVYNLFALLTCCKEMNYKKLDFAVGGDDFVVFSKDKINEYEVDIVNKNSEKIGMEFKFIELKCCKYTEISTYPYFYKYSVRNGLPIISPKILLERLFCPFNKNIKTQIDYLDFLNAQIPALGYPSSTHLIFYSIYKNTYNRVYSGYEHFKPMTIGQVFKLHLDSFRTYRYSYKRRTSLEKIIFKYDGINLRNKRLTKKDLRSIRNMLLNLSKTEIKRYKFK